MTKKPYEVWQVATKYDTSRPWGVVATFRNFNTVIARYATKEQAQRRCRAQNKRSMLRQD
jgi:hypothetical protein